jgi:hypothetical protein
LIFWINELIERAALVITTVADRLCELAEWHTHSDDIKLSGGSDVPPHWLPLFEDDDGDYCDDFDLFLEEYEWESNNDLT